MTKAEKIASHMMANDSFCRWLGVELLEISEGTAKLKMTVRAEMLNGHGIGHGGISFSLADSAFAFASNSLGQKTVSIETSINHIKPIKEGDELIAVANMESSSKKLGQFLVRVKRGDELVGLFKGVAFGKDEEWEV